MKALEPLPDPADLEHLTADALKISAVTLWWKMKQYGLSGAP